MIKYLKQTSTRAWKTNGGATLAPSTLKTLEATMMHWIQLLVHGTRQSPFDDEPTKNNHQHMKQFWHWLGFQFIRPTAYHPSQDRPVSRCPRLSKGCPCKGLERGPHVSATRVGRLLSLRWKLPPLGQCPGSWENRGWTPGKWTEEDEKKDPGFGHWKRE